MLGVALAAPRPVDVGQVGAYTRPHRVIEQLVEAGEREPAPQHAEEQHGGKTPDSVVQHRAYDTTGRYLGSRAFHEESHMPPSATSQAEPSGGSPLLAGIIAGVLLAVLWAFLVWFTHDGIALAAWGVGALVGITLAKSAREPNASLGILAGGITLGSVLLAKVLILAFLLPEITRYEILRDRQATTTMFMVDMQTQRSFSPELQAAIDSEVAIDSQVHHRPDTVSSRRPALSYRMLREAGARAAAAGPAERERVVRMTTESLLARRGFLALLSGMLGVWDLTWLGLGMSTAWKLAIAGWVS
jgi:hypothetical protein